MTPTEYLHRVLKAQTLDNDGPEVTELRQRRAEVEGVLRAAFKGADVTIRYGGSHAKRTMIRASYDLDLLVYFAHGENSAGENLPEIFANVKVALEQAGYVVVAKTSALRITKVDFKSRLDFHVDVVPGRYTDGNDGDVYLHLSNGEKGRLKTNVEVHVAHVRDSGCNEEIRLFKFWNCRRQIGVKTFVLELVVIKALAEEADADLPNRLKAVWRYLVDNRETLAVEDPANPSGNDLSSAIEFVKDRLALEAASALTRVEADDWEGVFGPVPAEETQASTLTILTQMKSGFSNPAKPWCDA
jgi:hypothetical protein